MTYWGATAFQFFIIFFNRLFHGFPGGLLPDEIQLITLVAVATSAALVGAFLVARKVTMIAAALTHTILPGLVLTYLALGGGILSMSTLLVSALVTSFFTVWLTNFCQRQLKLQEDASIGLIFTLLFALGILLVSCFLRNTHFGVEMILGNVDGLTLGDLKLSMGILVLNCVVMVVFYRTYFLTSFDPHFASSLGVRDGLITHVLMLQTALTIVGGFRAVGVILILALLTGPILIARILINRMLPLIFLAMFIGTFCAFLGVATSRHVLSVYDVALSTSGWVVTYLFIVYITLAYGKKTYCNIRKYRLYWAANAKCDPIAE